MKLHTLRVLHVTSSVDRNGGGPSSVLIGLASALSNAGCEVSVLMPGSRGVRPTGASILDKVNLRWRVVSSRAVLKWWSVRAEDSLADVDVVHIHGVWEPVLYSAAAAAQKLAIPFVLSPHGMLDRWSLKQKRLKKWVYRAIFANRMIMGASVLHAATPREARELSALRGQKDVRVIPHGFNPDAFGTVSTGSHGDGDQDWGLAEKTVLFVGRLVRGKGIEVVIQAMSHWLLRDFQLIIVGPDTEGYRSSLERLTPGALLGGRVKFLGALFDRDLARAYKNASVVCLLSEHENFGMIVLEALASGASVVLSTGVFLADCLNSSRVWVVDSLTPENVATAVAGAARDFARRESLSSSEGTLLAPFVWSRVADQWKDVYRDVLANRDENVAPA